MRWLCSATKAAEADNSGVVHGMSAQHPQAIALEQRLQQLAAEIGDATPKPFRVDMVRIHGGKPPVYSLVILSYAKEPLRRMLEQLLDRPLTCGVSSFMIRADEAQYILSNGQPKGLAGEGQYV